jgi:aminopeptidase N
MRKFLILLCLNYIAVKTIAQSKIDVLHYRFEISLSDNSDTIKGKAAIIVKFLEETDQLSFDLITVTDGKGMTVISVMENPDDNKMFLSSHINNKVIISLPQKKKIGETTTFFIRYKGIPADGLIIDKNKYGHRTFFADNWPNRAHHWIPCVDDPADKATVEFVVTAPSHYQVISNGIQVEESNLPDNKKITHWKEEVPLPTKVMVIGAADFAVNHAGVVNCIPVSSWVYPENKKEGFYDYAQATDILAFFISYIGPYPYKKLANVQSKTVFGGMENAGAIFYNEHSVTGNRQEEALVAHEIVHQWFGNMATEKSFAHLWLSEGFATYLTHIFIESKYGADSLNKEMAADRQTIIDFAKAWGKPVVDSVSPLKQLLNPNSYQKGSWVLHMLRRQLGDSVFHKIVRNYYDQYKGKNASTEDFKTVTEKISGKKLDAFFKQWLFTAGLPELKINWKYSEKQKAVAVTVEQLQQDLFQFPIEIGVAVASSKQRVEKLFITKKMETFSIPVKARPVRLIADPQVSLLFEGSLTELK